MRARDAKAAQKLEEAQDIWLNRLDERAFEKTVDEVKWRYYEVAQALLKHRGVKKHKLLEPNATQRQSVSGGGSSIFDIEYESTRKCDWERVFMRGADQVQKEKAALEAHLWVESQVRRVDQEDAKKWQLVAR